MRRTWVKGIALGLGTGGNGQVKGPEWGSRDSNPNPNPNSEVEEL